MAESSKYNGWLVAGTLFAGALVIAALIWLISNNNSSGSEQETGVIVVLAVSILVFLLFVLTIGFRALGLTDVEQPLALPSGSVRAFIALMLIMIFVIVSVLAVRLVGQGIFTYLGPYKEEEAIQQYLTKDFIVQRNLNDPNYPYRVWQIRQLTDDGIRLAQQLVTTVATLVVAVAGFYFGSQTVEKASEAVAASLGNQVAGVPLVRNIDPSSGETLQTVLVTLKGRNLFATKSVKLVKDKETIEAENVLSNEAMIQCSFKLDKPAGTTWNVVVENAQGEKDVLEDAFTITASDTPPLPNPPEQTESNQTPT